MKRFVPRKRRRRDIPFRVWRGVCGFGLLLLATELHAQTSAAPIEIEVKDSRLYSRSASGGPDSFAATLGEVPGLLVNSQGGAGIQSDLSIRGSSFSGAGLSVEGMALGNSQTEHFNSELPLPSRLFSLPRTLTGLDEILGSSGHLIGSVQLEFRPTSEYGRMEAGVGEERWNWQELFYNHVWKPTGEQSASVGAFGCQEQRESVDYDDNDLDRREEGAHFQFLGREQQTDIVVGHQEKLFGARGYYGVSPQWYADEELDDTLVLAGSRWGEPTDRYVRAMAFWRSTQDRYRLFWDQPDIYENLHRLQTAAISVDGRERMIEPALLNWRVDAESEDLESVRLGDHNRERGDLLLLPELTIGRARLLAGAKGCVFSGESPAILPQAGLKFAVADMHSLFVSYTESVRQPSYTELNYESPGSLGNTGLKRQEAENVEAGWRWSRDSAHWCQMAVFGARSRHTVDWVKELASSPRWVATDLGTVDVCGLEFSSQYQVSDRLGIQLAYTGLNKQYEGDPYAGRYVLDYPKHLLQIAGEWRITASIRGTVAQAVRWQEPTAARQGDDMGYDGRVAVRYCPQKLDGWEVTLACDNVWDDDFMTFVDPDQPVPGRRVSLAVAWSWK